MPRWSGWGAPADFAYLIGGFGSGTGGGGGIGSRHATDRVTVPATGLPLASVPGVKRKRRCARLHVVESSSADPLDISIAQPVTRPSAPTVSRTRTVPCSPARMAAAG